ncbi:hypothetical protein DPMN_143039 [Dreissena polymorpha]|uniref:Uncharacterized protein n=1 Tax=Dreissena polymorpha TaxID=45954 RepID=A0A9D4JNZ5_DREPO|nr:hypothetical protein DPMN_143039 [Dreissena polymorpha]
MKYRSKDGINVARLIIVGSGGNLDLETVGKEDLPEKLRKLYCEATPKPNVKREQSLPEHHRNEYPRTHWSIAGPPLTGILRRTEIGLSRPTQHKGILTKEDLEKRQPIVRNMKTLQSYYEKQHESSNTRYTEKPLAKRSLRRISTPVPSSPNVTLVTACELQRSKQ